MIANRKSHIFVMGFFVLSFAFWFLVMLGVPLSFDDRSFASSTLSSFKDYWNFSLNYGNGRLLGNLGVKYLVKSQIFRTFVKAFTLSSLTVIMPYTMKLSRKECYFACFILLILCSPGIFAQCYSWTSGFQNYVPPLFLFLFVISIVVYNSTCTGCKRLFLCAVLLSSICMQLYIEHSTCINILCGILLIVYARIKNNNLLFPLVFLIGALSGAIIMLAIPNIYVPELGMIGSREIFLHSGVGAMLRGMIRNGVRILGLYSENVLLLSSLWILTAAAIFNNCEYFPSTDKKLSSVLIFSSVSIIIANYTNLSLWYGKLAIGETIFASLIVIIGFSTCIISFFLLWRRTSINRYLHIFVLLFISIISCAPSLFVNPLEHRLIFHSYIIASCAVLLLLDDVLKSVQRADGKKILYLLTVCSSIIAFAFIAKFYDIARIAYIRDAYIESCALAGEYEIDYFDIPSDYVYEYWNEYTDSVYYSKKYNTNILLRNIPAELWIDNHYYKNQH